ncbi:pyridoxal phosphate-dependent decarboxylase family protein [Terriglobus albidus]|uniref:pyridoxal phosphate-dependent decarboxylase family protein n=1 Tax=Terriglobus albidus TaxID=1592106 RepID=UPI0021E06550|nr:aspartate aminotransferase family protein [Terriglobus albidus]
MEIVIRLFEQLEHAPITMSKSPSEIASLFSESLPEEAQPIESILDQIENSIIANSTLCLSPRFFGYINGSGNQAAIMGEMLAAAANQICAKWHFSPAASEVERQVIRWIADFVGYPKGAGGCLLSGGSAGNLIALAIARKRKLGFDVASEGMYRSPVATVYVSTEGHASIEKAMGLLGMGRTALRKIPVGEDFTINRQALMERVTEDRRNGCIPICVIGNAGTTNTGAVDQLNDLADFCHEQNLWFHVDGAYGGPAAQTKAAGALFRGLDRADSLVINPHKWLYVPVEAACILVRDSEVLPETLGIEADYLQEKKSIGFNADGQFDFKDYSTQLSRGFRALKVWMTFKAYGANRLRAAIESNIELMRDFANQIDNAEDFMRFSPVPLSVVCFQYRTVDQSVHQDREFLDRLNRDLLSALEQDGRIFLSGTKINGSTVLRACSVNHRLQRRHVNLILEVVRQVGSALAARLRQGR